MKIWIRNNQGGLTFYSAMNINGCKLDLYNGKKVKFIGLLTDYQFNIKEPLYVTEDYPEYNRKELDWKNICKKAGIKFKKWNEESFRISQKGLFDYEN